MADEKKPPDFDADRTVVDVRRPEAPRDDDRTIIAPRPGAAPLPAAPPHARPPAEDSGERTVVMTRRPAPTDDMDRTRVAAMPSQGSGAGDRTIVAPAGGAPAASPSGGDYFLVLLSGPNRGKRFPLGQGEFTLGSSLNSHVSLPTAETAHAKLRRAGDGYEIENTGSKGSVIAHGRPVTRSTLKAGDLIKIGDLVLRLVKVGDMFSSEYLDSEFDAPGFERFFDPQYLKENPLVAGIGLAILAGVLGVFFWPKGLAPPPPPPSGSDADAQRASRAQEVTSLLLAGEVLFKQEKYVAPSDRQDDEDNAYVKFNQVLALDPGNEKAREWMKKIDGKLDEARNARAEADRKRREAEAAALERQRAELAKRVEAILVKGDQLAQAGKMVEPAGDNALVRYQSALKIDPESTEAQERVRKAIYTLVEQGDALRDRKDSWKALEFYRKADRAAAHKDPEITARVDETEKALKSGMASTQTRIVIYRDDAGQLYVLDEMDKVPARFRDRAVEITPAPPGRP